MPKVLQKELNWKLEKLRREKREQGCNLLGYFIMKVLIAVNEWTTLVNFNQEVVEALLDKGYEVIISCPYDVRLDIYVSLGCQLIDTPMNRRGTNPFHDIALLVQYLKIFHNCKPDCVLTYTVKPNIYASMAAQLLGIPRINTVTGLGVMITGNRLIKNTMMFLQKIAMNTSACIFFPSTFNRQHFLSHGISGHRHKLVAGSGVNLSENKFEEYPQDEGKTIFLAVMRIMKDKGIFELIEAMRVIKQEYKVELHILGSYETGHSYYEHLQAWIAEGLVIYHGQQKDVHSFMKRAHCLIHPSYHEGMSNVCQEMAATGRPILASNIPGCQETFDEGISGFGFQARDTFDLIQKLKKFIQLEHEERRKMGRAGRDKMENEFDRQQVVKTTLEEIERAVKR